MAKFQPRIVDDEEENASYIQPISSFKPRIVEEQPSTEEQPHNNFIKDAANKFLQMHAKTHGLNREFNKTLAQEVPTGVKEGVQGSYAGLTGGEFKPSPIPDESGAGFGRGLGQMIGQGAVAAPIAAGIGAGGAALGLPALLAGLGGTAIGYGATTPGSFFDRLISGGEAALFHGGLKAGKAAIEGKIPFKQGYDKLKTIFETPKLREKALKAEENLASAEEHQTTTQNAIEETQKWLDRNFPTRNPEKLLKATDEMKAKQGILQDRIGAFPEEHRGVSTPEEPSLTDLESLNPFEAPETQPEAEANLKTEQQKHAENEKNVSTLLNTGETHDVEVAKGVVGKVKETAKDIGNEYDAIEEKLKKDKVTVLNTEKMKKSMKRIAKTVKESGVQDGDQFIKNAAFVASHETIPADKFVANYRTVRKFAQKMRSSAYEKDLDKNEQAKRLAKADEMDAQVQIMEETLEEAKLGDVLDDLKATNKRYATEVAPVFKTPIYNKFLIRGHGVSDIIHELRGRPLNLKEGAVAGEDIIKKIIKDDPELLKHVLGQRHANNPSSLHNMDRLSEEYAKHLPELEPLRQAHIESTNEVQAAKEALEAAKLRDSAAAKEATKKTKLQKLMEKKNNERLTKKYNEEKAHAEKAQASEKQYHEDIKEFQRLHDEVQKYEQASKRATEVYESTKASDANYAKAKKEAHVSKMKYEKSRKQRNELLYKLVTYGSGLVGIGGLAGTIKHYSNAS